MFLKVYRWLHLVWFKDLAYCPNSAKVLPYSAATLGLGTTERTRIRSMIRGMRDMGLKQFLGDETGAVTVDWVVLTAGVVVFAVFVMPPIQTAIVNMAIYIGDTIAEYHAFLD